MKDSTLIIVTGDRGAGKTTFCTRLIELARSAGRSIGGVLSPAIIVDGQKIAIDVIDLRANQRQSLAVYNPAANYPQELYWRFDLAALDWGNELLAHSTPCDVLIVDELGVLEFERNQGWLSGLVAIDAGEYKLGLVVIRPELLARAQQRWPSARTLTIESASQAQVEADRVWYEFPVS
ncbi:MAG: nucleoside-triphosphatase [Anaerolineae bacterium]